MRILELLLPKGAARDSSLSPRQLQELDQVYRDEVEWAGRHRRSQGFQRLES